MTSIEVPQISVQRYVELLKRRRWQVIPVSLIGLLVGGLVAFFIPRYYVAETLIVHQAVPGQLSTNPDDPFRSIVDTAYWTIPLAVTDAMEALKWPEARATGYELQENERAVRSRLQIFDSNQGAISRREYAQIRVTFKDRDGARSADFLNALVDVWIRKRTDELRAPAEVERGAANDLVRRLRQNLDTLTNEKQALELQYKIDPLLPDALAYAKLKEETQAQADLRRKHDDATRELAVLERLQQVDQDKLDNTPPRVKDDPQLLIDAVRLKPEGQKIAIELLYWQGQMANFQPDTNQHAEAKRNIAACEKKLRALVGPRDVDADGLVPNPDFEALRKVIAARGEAIDGKAAEVRAAQALLSAEEARITALSEGHRKYRRTLLSLGEVEKDYGKAQEALRGAEAVLASLGKEQPVRQPYRASAPPRPTDPNILLVALLGCILGLGLAVSLILLLDVVQGTFKTVEEVERALPVPVLGGMSHLETEVEREHLAKKRRRISFVAAGFVFLCVAVVTIFYVDATRLPPVVRDLLALLLGKS